MKNLIKIFFRNLNRFFIIALFVLLSSVTLSQNLFRVNDINESYILNLSKNESPAFLKERYQTARTLNTELIISPFLGGIIPIQDLKGNTSTISLNNSSSSAKSYFEKYGFFGGLAAKLPVGKGGMFRPKITFIYNRIVNSGADSSGLYTVEPVMNIYQFSLGAEVILYNKGQFKPFIEADFTANIFTGSIIISKNDGSFGLTANYNRNVRYGINTGAGLDYAISKNYSLIGGVKFNIANLIGREYDNTGAHDLNDAETTINGLTIDQKTISYISIYIGVALNIRD